MKILFLNTRFFPDIGGGVEVVLRSQAKLLKLRGHEIAIAALGDGLVEMTDTVIDGIRVFRCPHHNNYFPDPTISRSQLRRLAWHWNDQFNSQTANELQKILLEFEPDVVWCHSLAGWSISAWDVIKRAGIPTVQVLHDQYFMCVRSNMFRKDSICERPCITCRILRRNHSKATKTVDAVIGVSQYILDKLTQSGHFEGVPVQEVMYNVKDGGIPTNSHASPPENFTFGFIGTLTASKGIRSLLSAFQSLDHPDIRLLVAGTGKKDFVDELQREYSDSRISFLGHQDPADFFQKVNVSLVPSIWNDTLPTVVFEAHANGIPVVGSNRGGIPEMISPNCNGWLFEPDQPNALRDTMISIIASSPLPKEKIKETAKKFYDSERWISHFEDISKLVMCKNFAGAKI